MSRPLRIQYPNAHYHVIARGNERRRIFWEEKDFEHFLILLEKTCERFDLRIFAFVLMTNHIHLMVETPLGNLSAVMHWLTTSYSVWVNRRRRRSGHLFQGRYRSILIEDESYYLELSRYIHLNPVRAGVAERPERYRWSSCGDYLGPKQRWPFVDREPLLCEFGKRGNGRYSKYREFLYEGVNLEEKALAVFRRGGVLGSDSFKAWVAENFMPLPGKNEDVSELTELGNGLVSDPLSCKEARMRLMHELRAHFSRRADHRGTMMVMLHRMGYPLREIGNLYGVGPSAVSQHVRRIRFSKREKVLMNRVMSNVKR